MAERNSKSESVERQAAAWLLSILLIAAVAVFLWWMASDVVIMIIQAFEIIAWLLGLMLWPFRI